MKFSVNLLESLIAIAESLSLAEAAQKLSVTQPALSMQLKRLEEQFQLPLFEFQGKRKILTSYGLSIYHESKRLLGEFNLAFEQVDRNFLEGSRLSLRVGGRRELLLRAQKSLAFDGKIFLNPMSSAEALKALEQRHIDVAISRIKPDSSDFIAKKFLTNCPWLVTHKKWLKDQSQQKIASNKKFFIETPLIIYTESGELASSWLAHLDLRLADLNVKYVIDDWLTILQMIESGEGYSIIPDSIESNLDQVRHIELPREAIEAVTYYFVYPKNLSKTPAYKNIFMVQN